MNQNSDTDALFAQEVFAELPRAEVSASLARRVAEIPLTHPRPEKAWFWPFQTIWKPVLSWSLAASLGLWAGAQTLPESGLDIAPSAQTEDAQTLADNSDSSWESVDGYLALAWGADFTDTEEWDWSLSDTPEPEGR